MPFLTTKTTDRAIRDSGRTLSMLAFPYGLHLSQLSRALNGHAFGDVIANRIENLAADLGVAPEDALIEIEAEP